MSDRWIPRARYGSYGKNGQEVHSEKYIKAVHGICRHKILGDYVIHNVPIFWTFQMGFVLLCPTFRKKSEAKKVPQRILFVKQLVFLKRSHFSLKNIKMAHQRYFFLEKTAPLRKKRSQNSATKGSVLQTRVCFFILTLRETGLV